MRRGQSAAIQLILALSILLMVAAPMAAQDGGHTTGLARWRAAQGDFRDWQRTGVRLDENGALQLDPSTAQRESDPHPPGTYHGKNFFNGSSFLVGEALSPITATGFGFEEAIASWNANTPPGTWIETQLRARIDDRWTAWYILGIWASDTSTIERHTVDRQDDADGYVDVETLVLNQDEAPAKAFQLKLRLFSADGVGLPDINRASVAFSRSPEKIGRLTPGNPNRWDRFLAVPECSQMVYPDGGSVWCSPTSTSMVLDYWRGDGAACEPGVRAAVAGVFDWVYEGHGNWSFNTAYVATRDFEAYVVRFANLAEAERWIGAGVPIVVSLAWAPDQLTGAPLRSSSGHLMVLVGFDAVGNPVVNDPAAPDDATVRHTYIREEFERIWLERRSGTGYLIYPNGWPASAMRALLTRLLLLSKGLLVR